MLMFYYFCKSKKKNEENLSHLTEDELETFNDKSPTISFNKIENKYIHLGRYICALFSKIDNTKCNEFQPFFISLDSKSEINIRL